MGENVVAQRKRFLNNLPYIKAYKVRSKAERLTKAAENYAAVQTKGNALLFPKNQIEQSDTTGEGPCERKTTT
jgi:hypothetical protein